jgi:hypothetical protein
MGKRASINASPTEFIRGRKLELPPATEILVEPSRRSGMPLASRAAS